MQAQQRPLPMWWCPKCGAVCGVKYNPAHTVEEYFEYADRVDRLVAKGFAVRLVDPVADELAAGSAHGEHLRLSCTRCGWRGHTPVLPDPSPLNEPTPIYESMVS